MTAQTGRTHSKFVTIKIGNSSDVVTDITPYINNLGEIGAVFDSVDVSAWSDGAKNYVIGWPDFPFSAGGPFDTTVHTLLAAQCGTYTPRMLDVKLGIRHAWEDGEPQIGITKSATSGILCNKYTVNPSDMTWSADFVVFGSTAPAWGTTDEA